MVDLMGYLEQALKDVELYQEQLLVSDEEMRVGLEISDTEETATLILKEKPEILAGLQNCDVKFTFSNKTLQQVAKYEKDGFALATRATMSDPLTTNFSIVRKFYNQLRPLSASEPISFCPEKSRFERFATSWQGKRRGLHPFPLRIGRAFDLPGISLTRAK